MTIKTVELNWELVEKNKPNIGYINSVSITDGSPFSIAIDNLNKRHLLFPLGDIQEAIFDKKSNGINVEGKIFRHVGQEEKLYLDVCCIDSNGYVIFDLIIKEIIEQYTNGRSIQNSIKQTMNNWRNFWLHGLNERLSENAIKGLIGELWLLFFYILPKNKYFINNWLGPQGNKHDFVLNDIFIEVKTTSSKVGIVHKITNINQLSFLDYGKLFLFSLKLNKDDYAQNTLPLLVEKIEDYLSDCSYLLEVFQQKLNQIGYYSIHSSEYDYFKFRVVNEGFYEVKEGFPIITFKKLSYELQNGAMNVEYEIDLSMCQEYLVNSIIL